MQGGANGLVRVPRLPPSSCMNRANPLTTAPQPPPMKEKHHETCFMGYSVRTKIRYAGKSLSTASGTQEPLEK